MDRRSIGGEKIDGEKIGSEKIDLSRGMLQERHWHKAEDNRQGEPEKAKIGDFRFDNAEIPRFSCFWPEHPLTQRAIPIQISGPV